MNQGVTESFRRLGESAIAAAAIAAVIGGTYSGIVAITGGRIIPWATPDEVQRIVDRSLMRVYAYQDYHECADYNDRFKRAQQALQRNAEDRVAQDLFNASREKLQTIPNCMPVILPAESPERPPGGPPLRLQANP